MVPEKTAVILFNLGGPDSRETIRPFLFNFFMDKNIIRLPLLLRFFIAKLISIRRSKKEAGASYGEIGNRSPLLENSQAQAKALTEMLNQRPEGLEGKEGLFKAFVCMRYWHPMADQIVKAAKEWGAQRVILLPLYPQYSTTTTRSSLQQWHLAMQRAGLDLPTSTIGCYPLNAGFIKASVKNIRQCYDRAQKDGHKDIRILFSAHGLPEKFVKDGDPYQWQCEQTVREIVKALNIENLDWQNCYQSRVGRMEWIGPSTEEALAQAAQDKKAVIIYPHAFTQEHVETLVELDIEYREKAHALGLEGYYRAQTVGTDPDFITGLADLVGAHLDKEGLFAEGLTRLCPPDFQHCCMNKNKGS
ncbi:MAG: ferrochelatase [Alphaproteobacteria bacterium]|nr:ferrochelatase [Alphaproteobacteria bacterium]